MNRDDLRGMLEDIRSGQLTVEEGIERMKHFPNEDLGFANLDTHRELRKGFPEVVFCQGKTIEQSVEIIGRLAARGNLVLGTRCDADTARAVDEACERVTYDKLARTIVIGDMPQTRTERIVTIITAGTSDIPVAEEAAITAETMGCPVDKIFDVGVAGIHRLLGKREKISKASVLVVVAGMEGALASVVGGMADVPVIAVPTSVGYGASFNGLAALLAMLNSCAPGVAVVNIDNGFGAGYFAAMSNLGNSPQ